MGDIPLIPSSPFVWINKINNLENREIWIDRFWRRHRQCIRTTVPRFSPDFGRLCLLVWLLIATELDLPKGDMGISRPSD